MGFAEFFVLADVDALGFYVAHLASQQIVGIDILNVFVLQLHTLYTTRGYLHRAIGDIGSQFLVDGDAIDGARLVIVLSYLSMARVCCLSR